MLPEDAEHWYTHPEPPDPHQPPEGAVEADDGKRHLPLIGHADCAECGEPFPCAMARFRYEWVRAEPDLIAGFARDMRDALSTLDVVIRRLKERRTLLATQEANDERV